MRVGDPRAEQLTTAGSLRRRTAVVRRTYAQQFLVDIAASIAWAVTARGGLYAPAQFRIGE
jgi:hypothetical protein